jgi:hypothetical protein
MRSNVGFWRIFIYIVIHCAFSFFSYNFFILYVTHVLDSVGSIVSLFMYSDCTNYVDPHTIITIFLMLWLYYMFFFTDGFVYLCSILAFDIFLLFYLLYLLDY